MLVNKKIRIENKKILIIAGYKSYSASGVSKYFNFHNCKIEYFFKKKKLPELSELKNIIKKRIKLNPDVILGIGGGSVLDISKMTAAFENEKIKLNSNKLKFKKNSYLILIPTIPGSGSEATTFAVLYKSKKKFSIASKYMKADKVFFYTEALKSLNKSKKLPSALDILCQSIESIFSIKSNKKSLNYSKKSLTLFNKNIYKYLKGDSSTFKDMLLASNYAGKAINITKTNVPHALSYDLTTRFNVDHGHAVFLNFFGFLNFLYQNGMKKIFIKKRFYLLFKIFKIDKKNKTPLFLLNKKISKIIRHDASYQTFGIDRNKEINKIIKNINTERLKNCPIKIRKSDIRKIIFFDSLLTY